MQRASKDRWPSGAASALILACLGAAGEAGSAVVRVPQQFSSIQAALDAAVSGDTVLVARGTYPGGLTIAGKVVTLASPYIHTGNPQDVTQTIIDGGSPILTIEASAGANTTIRGLTFRNGDYQIINFARPVNILDSRFIDGGGDQVSFENAGGLVRGCFFDNAGDDGIDSDDASDPTITNNTIQNSGNDGIEIRLHAYTGPTLQIVIRDNVITGCTEDGIQLIDYDGASSRTFRIEHNVLANNGKAGLGSMANGATNENFEGAPMVEQVLVIGNTFTGNPHGLTGGDNMLVMNNIFTGSTQVGVKRVAAASWVTYSDFWNNGTHHIGSNVNAATTLFLDPLLDATWHLRPGSPCIDAGVAGVNWNGNHVSAPPYSGSAPDLGGYESGPAVGIEGAPPAGLTLGPAHPNPSRAGFTVACALPDATPARIEIVDLAGRRVLARDLADLGPGHRVVSLPEAGALPAGVYLVRLIHGLGSRTTRAVVVK